VKPLTVLADSMAAHSAVAGLLESKGARVIEGNLQFGQFGITDECTVWHVKADELARMLADRSLYRKIPEFKRSTAEPIIIVEGDPLTFETVSKRSLRGALTFLALHNRVPVLLAADTDEVAELVYVMANQAQNGMGMTLNEQPVADSTAEKTSSSAGGNGGPPPDPARLPEYILSAIPHVSPAIAKAMLGRYGSLRAVFAASAKDLTKIQGIGPKKAKQIADFFAGSRHAPKPNETAG
jgi:DNA excision repair protein ERCC-4